MKKKIDVYEHMGEILKGVKSGVLVTGKADDRVNSMTISWGMVGVEWGKPVFITFVRESRFTRSLLEIRNLHQRKPLHQKPHREKRRIHR